MILKLFAALLLTTLKVSCQECDTSAKTCFAAVMPTLQNLTQSLTTNDLVLSDFTRGCPTYNNYKRCITTDLSGCPPSVVASNTFLINTFQYICEDAREDIMRYQRCWKSTFTKNALLNCGTEAVKVLATETDVCNFFSSFEDCARDAVTRVCDATAGNTMFFFLRSSNNQNKIDLNCTDVITTFIPPAPTVTPPASQSNIPIRCYDCNSGTGWDNKNCPANGQLKEAKVKLHAALCDGICFSRTHRWNKGTIFRGCTKYHPGLPRPLPRRGCHQLPKKGEIWCFCDSDYCNTNDMQSLLGRY